MFTLLFGSLFVTGQELPLNSGEQLENINEEEIEEEADDEILLLLESFRKHPLNINRADAAELQQLTVLTQIQISNLLSYRELFGSLTSLYELQAVPGWYPSMIRKILPFITVTDDNTSFVSFWKRFKNGGHSLVIRAGGLLETRDEYDDTSASGYAGDGRKIFARYRYNFKDLLRFGVVADKDAGEQFFGKHQPMGFDFYSAHIFIKKIGIIESLALGDYSVNLGQGLIQWHGMGLKKSSEVMSIKRQSTVIVPYSSAGEHFFFRGIAVTLRKNKFQSTFFYSLRKLDANLFSIGNETVITSFLTGGYHRTLTEIMKRGNSGQRTAGLNLSFGGKGLHAGFNLVTHQFSHAIDKRDEPYNYFSIPGRSFVNYSFDAGYTWKNFHFFTEAATDKRFNRAFIAGAMFSVSSSCDVSLLYRNIDESYTAVYANAFTENTAPVNENGIYAGLSLRPASAIRIDAYADLFRFPWLKYQVDAPGAGSEYLIQVSYTPKRGIDLYARYRIENKSLNLADDQRATHEVAFRTRRNFRVHMNVRLGPALELRSRVEAVSVEQGEEVESGSLFFTDLRYKPMMKPFSVTGRLQFFEVEGYAARIYAYENDVMYSYSVPAVSGSGIRYYLNIEYDLTKYLTVWLRAARTVWPASIPAVTGEGSAVKEAKTDWKLQFRINLK